MPVNGTPTRHAVRALANSSNGNTLDATSCASPGNCDAVGQKGTAQGEVPLIDEETSGVWRTVAAPVPVDASSTSPNDNLTALDCVAAGSCVAVGDYANAVTHSSGGRTVRSVYQQALIEEQTDGVWSAIPVPLPADASVEADNLFASVSCDEVGTCVAVGEYVNSSGDEQLLLDVETSGSWANAVAPLPGNADLSNSNNELDDVSCTSPTDCVAVGFYLAQVGGGSCPKDDCQEAIIDVEAAGAWSAQTAPLPSGASPAPPTGDALGAVACSSVGNCTAGGSYVDTSGNNQALLEVDEAGSWSTLSAPLPSDASTSPDTNAITAVSCPSDDNCLAVGQYDNQSEYPEGLIETETGGVWTAATAPLPPDARANQPDVQLNSVSCASVASCVAVGTYVTPLGDLHPRALLLVDFGGTWLAGFVELPDDANTDQPYSQLAQVGCASSVSCVAVGFYVTSKGLPQVLLDQWSAALTTIPVVPGIPTDVTVKVGPAHARITWTPPGDDGGSPITRYVVSAHPGGSGCSAPADAISCAVWPLVAGARDWFTVVAENELGTSASSSSSAIFTIPPAVKTTATIDPFPPNSAMLTTALKQQIKAFAKRLIVDGDTDVDVVGYSDTSAPAHRDLVVSRERADAVKAILLRYLGVLHIKGVTIVTSGEGSADPVASNNSSAGRAKNRRVVVSAT